MTDHFIYKVENVFVFLCIQVVTNGVVYFNIRKYKQFHFDCILSTSYWLALVFNEVLIWIFWLAYFHRTCTGESMHFSLQQVTFVFVD